MKIRNIAVLLFIPAFLFPIRIFAAMRSANYVIETDAISTLGGGSSSGAYQLELSLLSFAAGQSKSASYGEISSLLGQVNTFLTLSLSTNSVSFGDLLPQEPASSGLTISALSDAWNGYVLQVSEDNKLTHTDSVTTINDITADILSPQPWSGTGLGFTVSSATCLNAKWGSGTKYAAIPTASTQFHSTKRDDGATCPGYQPPSAGNDETALVLKVAPGDNQKAGVYANTVTITAVTAL